MKNEQNRNVKAEYGKKNEGTIKRIVYGKQKISQPFQEKLFMFLATLDNFSIQEIVNQVLDN